MPLNTEAFFISEANRVAIRFSHKFLFNKLSPKKR